VGEKTIATNVTMRSMSAVTTGAMLEVTLSNSDVETPVRTTLTPLSSVVYFIRMTPLLS
jgi:hypothetical protein